MLTYLAIAQRYRPRWLVWENVPGVLSSNGGRDFGTFLGALGVLGYGWAYRVLDAQWFGVAQRRRRVFVVAHFGDWQRAAKVLFERESVRRDTPPSREARQGAAAGVGGGPDGGRIAGTVSSKWSKGSGGPAGDECYNMVAQVFKVRGGVEREDGSRGSTNIGKQAGKGYLGSEERAFTLAAAQDQFVAQPIPFRKSRRAQSVDDHETWVEDGIANTLNCHDVGDIRAVDVVAQPVGVFQDSEFGVQQYDSAGTLRAGRIPEHQMVMQPVAYGIDGEQNASEELIGTLRSHQSGGYEGARVAQLVAVAQLVPDVAPTLDQRAERSGENSFATSGGLVPVAQPVYGTDCYNGAITGDVAATLGTPGSSVNASGPTVMQPIAFKPGQSAAARSLGAQVDIACTLEGGGGGNNKQAIAQPVATVMQVRRLTPTECERLQGFSDGYTNIPWRKKPEAPDGPRYKALGNSMAVPCMAWIGKRIAEVDNDPLA